MVDWAVPIPRTRCYRDDVLIDENFALADVSEHFELPNSVVWVDLCTPDGADLALLTEELGLHELAVEDATKLRQRPKLDHYPDHSFLSGYAVGFDPASKAVTTDEIAAFITARALVTVHKEESIDLDAVVARWDSFPDLAKHGVAFLLHGLFD
ncbi:CorA family divalent cation transporter [Cryobacterium sp. M23]|uniref:CorA family divalent cation transporter n=1 Tax=Cryobacterium sp. M23 TaxID=2048292 RepID=UPI001E2AC98F|nr:CorA family divalent cation transporter [Cryobacterium sp. M23]